MLRIKRMLLTQAVTLAMPGVPGIYFHSLVGSKSYHEGVKLSGINRTVNREKFNYDRLVETLSDDNSIEKIIFTAYRRLISIRINEKSFNPFGSFEFLSVHKSVFAIVQGSLDEREYILALHNFSNQMISFSLPQSIDAALCDLLSAQKISKENRVVSMQAYQVMWLKN